MVVFPSTVVEIRVLPVISRLCWRSVPESCESWDSCCLETLALRNSVLRQRSWVEPRRLRYVGVVRRLLTGPVQIVDGVFRRSPPRAWLLAKQHAWTHGKVLQTEKTLVRDDFGKQRCEAAETNSRGLLMARWNERRPECAHQLTGETEGWKMASARAPTRLHRCAVCDKWLHTDPSLLLHCWKAAGHSSQNDPLHIANYGGVVRDLRSTWIAATNMEHYQERRASRTRRDNLASCLASREV